MAENQKTSAGRRGRPPSKTPLPKRVNVMFRLTEMTRGKLMRLAEEAGRSMSEELEFRAEQSIRKDVRLHALTQMIGGKDMLMFAALSCGDLRLAIQGADEGVASEKSWYDDERKMEYVKKHMAAVMDRQIDTFASIARTGTATRSGEHALEERDGFQPMLPDQITEAIIEAYEFYRENIKQK